MLFRWTHCSRQPTSESKWNLAWSRFMLWLITCPNSVSISLLVVEKPCVAGMSWIQIFPLRLKCTTYDCQKQVKILQKPPNLMVQSYLKHKKTYKNIFTSLGPLSRSNQPSNTPLNSAFGPGRSPRCLCSVRWMCIRYGSPCWPSCTGIPVLDSTVPVRTDIT